MPTALQCYYRPGGVEDRLHIRDVHVEYMIGNQDLVQSGGAIVEGLRLTGMYLLLATDSENIVDEFVQDEPYFKAGLFQKVERVTVVQFIPEPRLNFLQDLLVESRRVARELASKSSLQGT